MGPAARWKGNGEGVGRTGDEPAHQILRRLTAGEVCAAVLSRNVPVTDIEPFKKS
jgi:hypothetical protein